MSKASTTTVAGDNATELPVELWGKIADMGAPHWKVTFALHDMAEIEENFNSGWEAAEFHGSNTQVQYFREQPIQHPDDVTYESAMPKFTLNQGLLGVYRNPKQGFTHLDGKPHLNPGDIIRDKYVSGVPGVPDRRAWKTILSIEPSGPITSRT